MTHRYTRILTKHKRGSRNFHKQMTSAQFLISKLRHKVSHDLWISPLLVKCFDSCTVSNFEQAPTFRWTQPPLRIHYISRFQYPELEMCTFLSSQNANTTRLRKQNTCGPNSQQKTFERRSDNMQYRKTIVYTIASTYFYENRHASQMFWHCSS